jgi:hypothetical protein
MRTNEQCSECSHFQAVGFNPHTGQFVGNYCEPAGREGRPAWCVDGKCPVGAYQRVAGEANDA